MRSPSHRLQRIPQRVHWRMMFGPKARHAVSRWVDIIVCDSCGTQEALEQASLVPKRPLTEWAAVKLPQVGGGPWKR